MPHGRMYQLPQSPFVLTHHKFPQLKTAVMPALTGQISPQDSMLSKSLFFPVCFKECRPNIGGSEGHFALGEAAITLAQTLVPALAPVSVSKLAF